MVMCKDRHIGMKKQWRRFGVAAFAMALVCLSAGAAEEDASAVWSKGRHFQTQGDVVSVTADGIHDPTNTAVKVLQEPTEAMKAFPRDSHGIIDWVKVLNQGLVAPRVGMTGTEKMEQVDLDIIFTRTGSMPNVRFPHREHTQWLTCINCHPGIFLPQKGSNPITMSGIIQGKYCGVCHGKVAFPPTLNCGRCHSVPNNSAGIR